MVMASFDANEWIEISKIKGAGNSNELKEYSYSVTSNYSNYKYFKLKQTDFDGKYTYSKIIYTDCDNINIEYYPIPFEDELNINSNNYSDIKFLIYDKIGQLVYNGVIKNGLNKIDLSKLSSGIYYIEFDKNKIYKLLKK
jgi:hypothetical protein